MKLNNSVPTLALDTLSPGQNLEAYIQTVNTFELLSAEEEKALAESLYYDQDLSSARRLVMSHLRFVVHIAKTYSGYGLNQGDLIQEGNVGLMKAVRRFNPEVGVRLVSFAVHWIKAEIQEFILRNWRIVKIATTKAQRKLFFNLRSSKKRLGWLNETEAQDIADALGVTKKTVYDMEGRLTASDAAFDGFNDDDDDGVAFHPSDYLQDENDDPALTVERANHTDDANSQLFTALEDLDDRSRDIIQQRWLSEEKATLHDLAEKYGVSAERIRQLEKNAMNKVKKVMTIEF
ncbi:RNA polymerase sigma factor RpoH [Reinekea marinisedimentorum]|uniref:RNA polymerase sigma factor RpoH n=1 Tax=Reinekea marinisedimentorum TaxID=230495 RepID=A0A4R3HVC2_9GAMM|nr:RNA polymerase sigma factor RpoH [Reinekea marinisedimentorum]TCS37187.1 RNA polymerase sigma-32 factor [Reinekea marinisedimentorum]